jgi:hypothetical protein
VRGMFWCSSVYWLRLVSALREPRKSVMVWFVLRRNSAESMIACLAVGVTNHSIHVSISRLGALSRSPIGVSNSILSLARSESACPYSAMTCGVSFSSRFRSRSCLSRPWRSSFRVSHT